MTDKLTCVQIEPSVESHKNLSFAQQVDQFRVLHNIQTISDQDVVDLEQQLFPILEDQNQLDFALKYLSSTLTNDQCSIHISIPSPRSKELIVKYSYENPDMSLKDIYSLVHQQLKLESESRI